MSECTCQCPKDAHVREPFRAFFGNVDKALDLFCLMRCTGIAITPTSHYPCRCAYFHREGLEALTCPTCGQSVPLARVVYLDEIAYKDETESAFYRRLGEIAETVLASCPVLRSQDPHEPIDVSPFLREVAGDNPFAQP